MWRLLLLRMSRRIEVGVTLCMRIDRYLRRIDEYMITTASWRHRSIEVDNTSAATIYLITSHPNP